MASDAPFASWSKGVVALPDWIWDPSATGSDLDAARRALRQDLREVLWNDATLQLIGRLIDLDDGPAKVLELAAGRGGIVAQLLDRSSSRMAVTVTEMSDAHLQRLRDAFDDRHQVTVVRHDLDNDPFPEGPWTMVHARFVLEHLDNPGRTVSSAAAELASDGVVLIEDALPWSANAADGPALQEAIAAFQADADGPDTTWGETLATTMASILPHTDMHVSAPVVDGGSVSAAFVLLNLCNSATVTDRLGTAGLDALASELRDPSSRIPLQPVAHCWGLRS